MNPQLLAALLASLADPTHKWKMMAVVSHTDGPTHQTVTYQLQSEPLELFIVAIAHIGTSLERISVYFRGSAFETTSTALYSQLASMASGFLPGQQVSFERALTRQKEADSQIQLTSKMEASGVWSGTA